MGAGSRRLKELSRYDCVNIRLNLVPELILAGVEGIIVQLDFQLIPYPTASPRVRTLSALF